MTDEQFIEWLESESAIRCVLMEIDVLSEGVETTRYISDKAYVTGAVDVPSHTAYSPIIAGGVKFTEKLSIDGSASVSYGDIELRNPSGELDSWLDDIWNNRSVSIFIGDVRWPRADFRRIFSGVVVDINTRSRSVINIRLSDILQRLNTPVSDTKLGGSTSNADRLIPLCFGECYNVEPLLVSEALHEYQVHNGPIERIIEVRDNGVPVSFTSDLANGKFKLNQSPAGTITCSVQGDKPSVYTNNIAALIKRLAISFGVDGRKLTTADLDTANFSLFETTYTQPVGLYLQDKSNVLEVCNRLATSIGARLSASQDGKLKLVRLDLEQPSERTVTADDMYYQSISVSDMPSVVASVKLGFCKNYCVQNNLETGIPESHKALYEEEWLTTTLSDANTADRYKLHTEPTMQETQLLRKVDADIEAQRRLNMFCIQRKIIKYKGYSHLLLESLGAGQTIQHERFSLSNGVTGQIVGRSVDWLQLSVELEVLL